MSMIFCEALLWFLCSYYLIQGDLLAFIITVGFIHLF